MDSISGCHRRAAAAHGAGVSGSDRMMTMAKREGWMKPGTAVDATMGTGWRELGRGL